MTEKNTVSMELMHELLKQMQASLSRLEEGVSFRQACVARKIFHEPPFFCFGSSRGKGVTIALSHALH